MSGILSKNISFFYAEMQNNCKLGAGMRIRGYDERLYACALSSISKNNVPCTRPLYLMKQRLMQGRPGSSFNIVIGI